MFNVTRYDPKQSFEQKRLTETRGDRASKRRKNTSESNEEIDKHESSSPHRPIHVIAPEVKENEHWSELHKKLPPKIAEEAFDDLDLVEQLDRAETGTSQADHQTEENDDIGQSDQDEIKTALHISEVALEEAAQVWKLAPFLIENLKRDGFQRFFPIQALAIPDVISSERYPHIQAQDVCITAPTGSGKTLAYAVPVINSLANRQIRRLRALIVLPSRDLAAQVHQVFENYVKGSDLKVGLAIGKSDFTAEQIALTVDDEKSDDPNMIRHRLAFEPGNLELALKLARMTRGIAFTRTKSHAVTTCWSTVDILVCTPGRLVDHLDMTPGFSLQHLRFLVVDEADRLMSQSYHNWIDRVIESANSASVAAWKEIVKNDNKIPGWQTFPNKSSSLIDPITWRRGGVEGDTSAFNINDSYFSPVSAVCKPVQLRKFLVSATLTRDPQKLAALRLVNPKHFDVHKLIKERRSASGIGSHRYSMPEELDEYTVECTAEQKPLVLLALLLEQLQIPAPGLATGYKRLVIVFTASINSTHRLARLLQLLWASGGCGEGSQAVVEFSSALNQKERSSLVQRCNDPKDVVSVVVCSDGMSRGMDIEHVTSVINYDVPSLAKTYVHRCGRTARAGKQGVAISLLKGGQVGQFSKLRQLIFGAEKVTGMKVKKSLVHDIVSKYRRCVAALRDVIDAEQNGELGRTEALSLEFIPSDGNDKDESDNETASRSSQESIDRLQELDVEVED